MTSAQQQATLAAVNCEIAFDNLTRQLYATDASIYQVEPAAVAFPKTARQASALIQAALEAGISVIPRGAGTGLIGGAIGSGLVIDFSRHARQITDLDLDRRTVRVGPGVVLDQLNAFLRPHRLRFGPDVATSSRATLGGMIANNSSGSHTPVFGTTADHISELEIVTANGDVVMVGPGHNTLRKQRELVADLTYFHALEIEERFPSGLLKRRPGYALERSAREPGNLLHLLSGSEGTLAAITAAELKIVPIPEQTGLGLLFFDSVGDAMEATVELLKLHPAAIEHLDRPMLDQTKGQREFQAARNLLNLDHQPCPSILAVEFFDHVADKLAALAKCGRGARKLILRTRGEANLVWAMRKAGLSLLTGCKGEAKPTTGIEDTAVLPERLPEYVSAMQEILSRLKLEASFYGHAASGLLHVRPILNLRLRGDRLRFRQLSDEVADLVRRFKGSLAAEHGVGMARTEYMAGQVGQSLLGVMKEIKFSFDPHNLFNPGKIVPVPETEYRIDSCLRKAEGEDLALPFSPVLAYAHRDESFLRNLEQCNGCGGCRKETPVMCPTFLAAGQEIMSTRGRANAIRVALEGRGSPGDTNPLLTAEMEAALSNCLSCKACASECPSNVDLALLKADLLHARIQLRGLSLRERLISSVDIIGAMASHAPRLANLAINTLVARSVMSKVLGLAWQRPLASYATQRFDSWFARRPLTAGSTRGRVVLWDDTFVRYQEPHVGMAAVKVLEAAGFKVELPRRRKCCGRPAFSQGHLDRVRALGRHNLELLAFDVDQAPIIFLEPSCYSMFVNDYLELKLPGADAIARRCHLFEEFIEGLLSHEPDALQFTRKDRKVVIHGHCHVKALMDQGFLRRLAERLPGREVKLLDTACCGMAGAFGAIQSKYELSLQVAEPLIRQLKDQPFGVIVVASGTSCRQQISHLAPLRPRHMAEVLADAIL